MTIGEASTPHGWGRGRIVSVILALLVVLLAPAVSADEPAEESHCIVEILEQLLDGELITGPPTCFGSFEEAMAFIGGPDTPLDGIRSGPHLLRVRPDLSRPFVRTGDRSGLAAEGPGDSTQGGSTVVIGTHFDGRYGGGSSITVVGSASSHCTGGYWNASSSWRNRISSSYNGCARLAHYDYPNVSGSRYDTTGRGQTDNLASFMDNRTDSVKYLSS